VSGGSDQHLTVWQRLLQRVHGGTALVAEYQANGRVAIVSICRADGWHVVMCAAAPGEADIADLAAGLNNYTPPEKTLDNRKAPT
jgi:hypothetical protein